MYSFCDTNSIPSGSPLPAEAICYDSKWIDNEIPQFRTLYVSGRESFSADITEAALESRDGSVFLRRRLVPRTITVGYQMTAGTASELMSAFNRLNALMSGTQVQVIFADEPDKYFIGTCKGVGSPEPGRLAVKGEMEIYCPDPCKYSTVLSDVTVVPAADPIEIEYGGTYPARPLISARMTAAGTEVTYELGGAAVQVKKSSFASGDVVEIDCNAATVRLNGTLTPSIGDIANDYEGMLLQPGTNLIGITHTGCSPATTVYYREAWL